LKIETAETRQGHPSVAFIEGAKLPSLNA